MGKHQEKILQEEVYFRTADLVARCLDSTGNGRSDSLQESNHDSCTVLGIDKS